MKKAIATDDMEDLYGHKVFKGEQYFEGFYLEKVDERKSKVFYKLLEKRIVFLHTFEIHHAFVDVDPETFQMSKNEYLALINSF